MFSFSPLFKSWATQTFSQACAANLEDGAALAEIDTPLLFDLAKDIRTSLECWASVLDRMAIGGRDRFDIERAADLVLESILEDVLEPPALRLVAALLNDRPD